MDPYNGDYHRNTYTWVVSHVNFGVDNVEWIESFRITTNPKPNNPPVAEAAVIKSIGGPYYGYNTPLTVTKGQSVSLYFFADMDVNGDGKASLDPDGWTHADNGVSSGGKCEWNTDLNQGTPTFEGVIANPAAAGNCNIGPYTYTFNDAPGTYEYQMLRITDRKGAQSNVSKIRITVVNPVTYSMSGTIHSGSNTGPVLSGATVSIAGKTTTTSSKGTFTITGIAAGTYAFTVSKSGYTTYTNPAYYVGSNQSGLNFYLTQTAFPGNVSVNPTSATSGTWTTSPQTVSVNSSNASTIYYTLRTTTDGTTPAGPPEPLSSLNDGSISGSSGIFQVYASAGQYKKLKVRFRGYNSNGYGTTTGSYLYTIDLRSSATGGVFGKLHANSATGTALSGATATCGGKTTTTGSDGSFSLSGITLGSQTLSFSKTGYQSYSMGITITAGQNYNAGDRWLVFNTPIYEGWIDATDCDSIRGWAWDKNQPNTPINVDIYNGSTKLTTVAANIFRQDLVNAGKGNGYHGFSYATPSS
jgi:hypothetical protein